ncbi:hypothetical protein OA610_01045 [Prochlorococcus sp. AH-716-F13]|nr:hypothetical protein [Prochlorococcus sp. AH-716-F13]
MKLANIFERKFLLSLGRHLWNILGISGFIGLLTGFILFIEGNSLETAKSRERYFGRNDYVTNSKIEEVTENMLSYEDWEKEEGTINKNLLPFDEWLKKNSNATESLLSFDEWILLENKEIPDKSTREYKILKNEYLKYQEQYISGTGSTQYDEYQIYRDDFFEKASSKYDEYVLYKEPFDKEQKRLTQIKKKQESLYSNYLEDVKDRNIMKRGRAIISPLIMGYGLAVIASASLSSAVLAIERNSREKN